ncbi:MAG: ABC-F family ATP-binding cassette domain-containing protein [Chloroflexota bacterium]|nr:ABC-F family ATP-binding cassette domain-containing protein [Chloroflexota bacterium]
MVDELKVSTMSILSVSGLAKSYGAQDVFWDVSAQIAHGDKIGLVGPNGEGKTTLLRIMAGLEEPTAGTVHRARKLRVGYLPQIVELDSERTVYDEMLTAFADLQAQQAELRRLEQAMANPVRREEAMRRYDDLLTRFEMAGGYTYEAQIRQVLAGLGFSAEEWNLPLGQLSGGQKTRALLARLLLQAPDLLLLDEPTNHLDLAALEWLEDYLNQWPDSLLVVAHDRRFLDKVVGRIWDLGFGRLEGYAGNYSHYAALRAERLARRRVEYEAQQAHIAKTEAFIRRYKAGQRSKEARGRQKRLDRLERVERPREAQAMRLRLDTKLRSGDLVLTTEGLAVGYKSGHPLFTCPKLILRQGQRAALIGPNGSGKTTFLRTVLGQMLPLAGEIRLGASLKIGYLPQTHETLNLEHTVLDEILEVKNLPLEKARTFLGRFLFSGDEVFKQMGDLSGGERSRVALAKLTLQEPNFLLLDEPTTHFDLPSQEVLQDVLETFQGTILLVSHDRYLIDALATQVWALENGRLCVYRGDYGEYLVQWEAENQRAAEEVSRERTQAQKRQEDQDRIRQRQAQQRARLTAQLEEEIAALEDHLAKLGQELALASAAQALDRVRVLGVEYEQVKAELDRRMAEWAGGQTA